MDTKPLEANESDGRGLPLPSRPTVATHWGIYRARLHEGAAVALEPYEKDADPSPIGSMLIAGRLASARILRPHVRASFLDHGAAAGGDGRGAEPFVPVDWDVALDLVASELTRVRAAHGNEAIYGGSYGWASAGRFHHAQSQLHRFLNTIGGYVRSVQNYSFAAGDVILPHVIGSTNGLVSGHTPWSEIAGRAELVVMFGGTPLRNAQVNSGGIGRHVARDALLDIARAGAAFVNVSPLRDDVLDELGAEWLGLHPNTDVALMLALAHVLIIEGLHDAQFLARYTAGFDRLAAYITGEADGSAKTPDWAAAITGHSRRDNSRSRAPDGAAQNLHHGRLGAATRRSWRTALLDGDRARRNARRHRTCRKRDRFRLRVGCGDWQSVVADRLAVTRAGQQRGESFHPGGADRRHVARTGRRLRLQWRPARLSACAADLLGRRKSVPPPPGSESPRHGLAAARDDHCARIGMERERASCRHRAAGGGADRAQRHCGRQPRLFSRRLPQTRRTGRSRPHRL